MGLLLQLPGEHVSVSPYLPDPVSCGRSTGDGRGPSAGDPLQLLLPT
jgi:hypothetical protein